MVWRCLIVFVAFAFASITSAICCRSRWFFTFVSPFFVFVFNFFCSFVAFDLIISNSDETLQSSLNLQTKLGINIFNAYFFCFFLSQLLSLSLYFSSSFFLCCSNESLQYSKKIFFFYPIHFLFVSTTITHIKSLRLFFCAYLFFAANVDVISLNMLQVFEH